MNDEEILPIKQEGAQKETKTDRKPSLYYPDRTETDEIRDEILPKPLRISPTRIVQVKVIADATTVTTGDNKHVFLIPPEFDFLMLKNVYGFVSTVSSSGALTIQVRSITRSDMLSTALTIDQGERTSLTAATPVAIDPTEAQVREGDLIAIDVDGAGTNATGLGVVLTFG